MESPKGKIYIIKMLGIRSREDKRSFLEGKCEMVRDK
jgi:hypothetical protein